MKLVSSSRVFALIGALALAFFALGAQAQDARASASGEPTVAQIYQAANAGNVDRANAMIDQVLQSHPNSAKAHYVKAELSARQGKYDVARSELAAAEKIAPGLPFAKAESVQALRNQLSNAAGRSTRGSTAATAAPTRQMGAQPSESSNTRAASTAPAQRGFPWGTLAVVAGIVVIGAMVLRRRSAASAGAAGPYGTQPGYGRGFPPDAGGMQPGYPPQYPSQPSMGSSIARGVGTGLAVGAGMVAAQEIGRRMFDHGDAHAAAYNPNVDANTPSLDQIDEGMRRNLNTDMGGNDFGIGDAGSWDDGGGFDGGGGDWDS